jgi:hypothetical protein
MFYGTGINNFGLTLQKSVPLSDARSLDVRAEAFNTFNHTQFDGPAAVDGQVEDPNYSQIVSPAAPRLIHILQSSIF